MRSSVSVAVAPASKTTNAWGASPQRSSSIPATPIPPASRPTPTPRPTPTSPPRPQLPDPHNTTTDSKYFAGIANIYMQGVDQDSVGRCSASFLCFKNNDRFYTDISNYISVNNGLIVSWFTPTTLINLEVDSIINGMVTECIVVAATKIGANPFFGETFNLKVSSETCAGEEQVQFIFTNI